MLLAAGYGNNPNTGSGLGYVKVSLADGRHWDLLSGRPVTGDDRGDLRAGPMRWTCVEPLKKWRLDVEPNGSGIEWELYYEPTAPMWELLPMKVRDKDGQELADMYHMKEPGRWSGWVQIDGERISVDGFHGGRDRTFGVRVADKIDFWLWLDAGFEDRAIEAWIIESHRRHSQLRRRRDHARGRHPVEAVRQDRARRRIRRRHQAARSRDTGLHRRRRQDLPRHRRRAAPGRQRLLRAADGALPVRGSGRRGLLHPLPLGQQQSRATRRNRGQIDGARSADALSARRRKPAGASSSF